MEYYYFQTSTVRKQTEPLRLNKETEEKLRSCLNGRDKFKGTALGGDVFISKPKLHGSPRFIWFQYISGDICVYVLRYVFTNHDEYQKQINEAVIKGWREKHRFSEEEQTELQAFVEAHTKKESRDPLPEEYIKYEERPRGFEQSTEAIVYEMSEWVNGYLNVDDKYKKSIFNLVFSLVDGNGYKEYFHQGSYNFLLAETDGYEVCVRISSNNTGDNRVTAYYLLQVSEKVNEESLHDHNYDCEDASRLIHKAVKCYPYYILCDFKTWDSIENDSDANLALSSEELKILQGIEYPFFVSGLAGSGKSTILYYLFAHVYGYEHKNNPEHKLIFLSYSKKLVGQARKIVKAILCNYSQSAESLENREELIDKSFDRMFVPFQDFIKGEFLDDTEMNRFSKDKYIDYQRFKGLYEDCKLSEKSKYSADIVWSVIRTYIKGKDGSSYFSPDDYASDELCRKDIPLPKKIIKTYTRYGTAGIIISMTAARDGMTWTLSDTRLTRKGMRSISINMPLCSVMRPRTLRR